MKLQKKISIYFLIVSAAIFLLSAAASYFVIKNLVLEEVDETLEAEKDNLISQLQTLSDPEKLLENHSYLLEIFPIEKDEFFPSAFTDTLVFVEEEGEGVPFRQLKLSKTINGSNYLIIIRRSLIEREDLITGITVLLGVVFFMIFLSLNFINYFGEKRWWKPFYKSLDKLSNFNLREKSKVNFGRSDIDEFNTLNIALEKLTEKVRTDYRNLKEFSENASHEMQTPLAIIRSKLDVMIQDKSLSENQFHTIRSLYDTINRLAKLNQSLNLLTKIENEEFAQKENVNLSQMIRKHVANIEELINLNSLKIKLKINENIIVKINPFMAETLISNLLINAIKHNTGKGEILIELNRNELTIKNTGAPPQVPTKELFERFKKDKQTSDSPGLGLSIARKICELNNFKIEYRFINNLHVVRVVFEDNIL